MAGLWRNDPLRPEGKYLVRESSGEVLGVPFMVIGAKDPWSDVCLEAYAAEVMSRPTQHRAGVDVSSSIYRVFRRDGTEVEWPFAVMRADDPYASSALRAYASACAASADPRYARDVACLADDFERWLDGQVTSGAGSSWRRVPAGSSREDAAFGYAARVLARAEEFRSFRELQGSGDPDGQRCREDDPVTVAAMRAGRSA